MVPDDTETHLSRDESAIITTHLSAVLHDERNFLDNDHSDFHFGCGYNLLYTVA